MSAVGVIAIALALVGNAAFTAALVARVNALEARLADEEHVVDTFMDSQLNVNKNVIQFMEGQASLNGDISRALEGQSRTNRDVAQSLKDLERKGPIE